MKFFKQLYVQVLLGLILGIAMGHFYPDLAIQFKFLADLFIKTIKMLIGPIIFLTLVPGIAATNDMRQVGSLAGGAIIFFTIITILAMIFGIVAANYFQPGAGMNIDPASLNIEEARSYLGASHEVGSIRDLVVNIIPDTFVSAFVDGQMLQVIFVSLVFAIGLILCGSTTKPIVDSMHKLAQVFFKIISLLMHLAPIATFAAIAYSVGKFGIDPLRNLAGLILCFYVTSIAFVVLVLGTILRLYCGIKIWQLIRYLKDEFIIVFGTASSEAVLPNLIQKLENLGCEESVVGLVLPLGYSFNLAGTAVYLTLASLFIAQATNTPLTLAQEAYLLGLMVISSKGAAGIAGSGFIILASSLATLGIIPPAGIVLVLGIDKFMNEGRAIINMTSNAIATIILSTWKKSFDKERALLILSEKEGYVEAV